MKHLFRNDDGECVAADTAEQANSYYWDHLCGSDLQEPWNQIPDDESVTLVNVDDEGQPSETKRAGEWAAEFEEPGQFSSTNC